VFELLWLLVAEVAEREGHHPDFCLRRWNQVSLPLTTHATGVRQLRTEQRPDSSQPSAVPMGAG
jgi:hypothetical protein